MTLTMVDFVVYNNQFLHFTKLIKLLYRIFFNTQESENMLNEQLAHFHEQRDEMIEQVRSYAASIETLRNQMLPIKEREKQASKLMYKGLCFLAGILCMLYNV